MFPRLALVGFVGLCLLVAASGAAVSAGELRGWYSSLIRPPGTPPGLAFGAIWGVLYVLMGAAAWLVWLRSDGGHPLRLWGWQLAANALWAPAFFGLHNPPAGLAIILVLAVLVGVTIHAFFRVHRAAAWMMAPYMAWVCYAGYLNAGFWWLNPV
jgi:tryptophan-rich sensory protein